MFWTIATRLKQRSGKYVTQFVKECHVESTANSHCIVDILTKDDEDVEKVLTKKPEKQRNRAIIAKLIADGCNLDKVPSELFKKSTVCQNVYLVNKNLADQYASLIAPDLKKARSPIFEVAPGLGYLTENLLDAGVDHIHLFEKKPDFISNLQSLIRRYPDRVTITNHDLFALPKLVYMDEMNGTNVVENIMKLVTKHKWSDEPALYIIGTLTSPKFLHFLCYSLTRNHLFDYGRIGLYLAIPPSTALIFGDTKMTKFHRPRNILLQLLFSCEELGTLPRRAFLPWLGTQKKKRSSKYEEDSELLHVVKLVPKSDFFADDFTKFDAEMFFYFLSLSLRPISTRIIPAMEKWVPDCGPRLIRMNFDIFTPFCSLSGLELLNLFKTFRSWPEYRNSVFYSLVEEMKLRRLP